MDLALVLAQESERAQELVRALELAKVQALDWGPELGRVEVQAPVGELE
jgi:hypothetical protein